MVHISFLLQIYSEIKISALFKCFDVTENLSLYSMKTLQTVISKGSLYGGNPLFWETVSKDWPHPHQDSVALWKEDARDWQRDWGWGWGLQAAGCWYTNECPCSAQKDAAWATASFYMGCPLPTSNATSKATLISCLLPRQPFHSPLLSTCQHSPRARAKNWSWEWPKATGLHWALHTVGRFKRCPPKHKR